MKLEIAICDDDSLAIEKCSRFLFQYSIEKEHDFNISKFTNGQELIAAYESGSQFHIIFLDMEMSQKNGMQTASEIRERWDKKVLIVFISSYPQYMQQSFRVHPFYYLTKPYTQGQFVEVLDGIMKEFADSQVFITAASTDGENYPVNVADIYYIEATRMRDNYIVIHFCDSQLEVRGKIKEWSDRLEKYGFVVCYRGTLVNVMKIRMFNKAEIVMENGVSIPISRKYEKQLRELYVDHVVGLYIK